MNYASVAKRVEISRRRENVEYSKHVEVACLKPAQQEKVLDQVEKERLTVKDVRRAAKRIKRTEGSEKSEIELLHTPEVKEYLDRYLAALKELEESVPLTARFLRLMAQSHQAQVHWQMNRSIDADCEAIMLPVKKYGAVAEDDLYTWLIEHGYFMSDPELDERLDYMQRDDVRMLRITDAGKAGKQEERRGKLPQIYVKWFKDWGEHYKQHRPEEDDEE